MERKEAESIQQVVRSFVVSLAYPEEIYDHFVNGEKFHLLKFYMGLKGDQKKGWRYTLIGGKINSGENFSEAIQRETGEEADLRFLGIPRQTIIGQWQYLCEKSGKRKVILTYNPVLLNEQINIGDGIAEVKSLNIGQLKNLIEEGILENIPIEGHLAIASKDNIQLSKDDEDKKNQALNRGISWMKHIEDYLRKKFESLIKKGDGSFISQEEFEKAYQEILSEFMRRGLEVGIRATPNLQEDQLVEEKKIIEALNSGFLGRDILYYLPEIAKYGLEWEGLNNATEGVKTFIDFLKDVFNRFLSEKNLSQERYQRIIESNETCLEEKYQLINQLDQSFRERIKEIFGLTDDDLNKVLSYISNFFRDLSNEMKVADPNLTKGLYQDFVLINEVNNANFGYLLSLFLGYDTKENSQHKPLIKFEAGRHLLLLLKAFTGIKYYESQIEKIRRGRLQLATNNFFGPIVNEQIIEIDNGIQMRVKIREKDGQRYLIDEKPTKIFTSFLRKSFEEKFKNIKDIYTTSISFLSNDLNNIEKAKDLIKEFLDYLKSQFKDFEVTEEDKRDYGTEKFLSDPNNQEVIRGKRRGSQGSRFVRTKLLISLIDKKSKERIEVMELIIYPIFSIEDKDDFFGWLETREDDKNYVIRRLFVGEYGIPSLYDLLFPQDLYPHHYRHKLNSAYYQ